MQKPILCISEAPYMPLVQYNTLYNRRIERIHPLISPEEMIKKIPLSAAAFQTVLDGRAEVEHILSGKDRRLLVIAGPCSIHDPVSALDYAQRLCVLRKKYADVFCIIMRVYFEKPRTNLGWRGFIVEPGLDGIINIAAGLEKARTLLVHIAELGLPAASEILDPIIPQYTADLISWASIGARSAESQIHRELASGLSMPVGFKNPTDGAIEIAINAIISARQPHAFLGVMQNGLSAVMHTAGNEYAHLVLRGGSHGSNYDAETISRSAAALQHQGIEPALLIDCSHGNSQKNPQRQFDVFMSVLDMRRSSVTLNCVRGCMLESFIHEGSAAVGTGTIQPSYGISITDPCMSWEMTEQLLSQAAVSVRSIV